MAISYSAQTIDTDDIKAVTKVLRSSWLTTGPWVHKFELAMSRFVNSSHAVALSSGTAALHAACFAAGIKQGDQVITTPYSFLATANSILYCGGKPVFVDIAPGELNIDVSLIEKKITSKTKAIIAVDFAGHPANWEKLREIAVQHKLVLIDDAAHSLGAEYKGKKIGTLADLTCFSFHPVKTITTGEGGMVVTNNKRYLKKILQFRNHGTDKASRKSLTKPWYYEMKLLGYNYRLSDIHSALGISQLKRAHKFIVSRRKLAYRYNKSFSNLPYVNLPLESNGSKSAWHLYPLKIDFKGLKRTKSALFRIMKNNDIYLQVHYNPIHLHPYYRKLFGYKRGDFPHTEKTYEQEVSLPLFPALTIKQQNQVIQLIQSFIKD